MHDQVDAPLGESGLCMEKFSTRMLLDMESALEKSIRRLPKNLDVHEVRTYLAQKIMESVQKGASTEDAMARAGIAAAETILLREKPFRWGIELKK